MRIKGSLASVLLTVPGLLAHPGHEEIIKQGPEPRSLNHCSRDFSHPEFVKRTLERHGEEYSRLRRALNLEAHDSPKIQQRDYISVSRIDHKSNKTVSANTDPATLFTDAGACILMPAVDQGPLYVLGEQVRKDITEGEAGIKMTLAIQVVDYKTCQVVPNAYVDIWSSNSTGMYVGVQGYPGMGDPKDASILKGTALRGVQPTDSHGVATFDTLLPGHYDGRATHIHAIVYLGAKKEANNTITGGKAAHVGQLYFDQSLLTAVDKVTPYNTNKMRVTQNTGDFLFMQGANGDDPIVRYALLGKTVAEGMFGWIRFGVNTNNNLPISPAAFMTESGGVMNPNGPIAKMNQGGWPGGGFGGGWGGPGRRNNKNKVRGEVKAEERDAE